MKQKQIIVDISLADVKYIKKLAHKVEMEYKACLLNVIRKEMLKNPNESWYGDLRWYDSTHTIIQYVTSLDERGEYYNEMEIPTDVLEWELKYTFHIDLINSVDPSIEKYKNFTL